jgi:amidophosphoribosyltransferase
MLDIEGVGTECGVAGYYLKGDNRDKYLVPARLICMGSALQHRGQKSAGITVYNPDFNTKLRTHKDLGLIQKVFSLDNPLMFKDIIERHKGNSGIWQNRYSTSGKKGDVDAEINEAQPYIRSHGRTWKSFALAFNGNIANYPELAKEVLDHDYILTTSVDTEVISHRIALALNSLEIKDGERVIKPDLFDVAKSVMTRLDGAYNILTLFADGDLLIFRDPHGFHPLVYSEDRYSFAIASESVALQRIGINKFQDVKPGEIIVVNKKEVRKCRI